MKLEKLIHIVKFKSLSRVRLFETPWTVAHQAPPSMGFSRQEYWSGNHIEITVKVPEGQTNNKTSTFGLPVIIVIKLRKKLLPSFPSQPHPSAALITVLTFCARAKNSKNGVSFLFRNQK